MALYQNTMELSFTMKKKLWYYTKTYGIFIYYSLWNFISSITMKKTLWYYTKTYGIFIYYSIWNFISSITMKKKKLWYYTKSMEFSFTIAYETLFHLMLLYKYCTMFISKTLEKTMILYRKLWSSHLQWKEPCR